jgi:hypothetical protein
MVTGKSASVSGNIEMPNASDTFFLHILSYDKGLFFSLLLSSHITFVCNLFD